MYKSAALWYFKTRWISSSTQKKCRLAKALQSSEPYNGGTNTHEAINYIATTAMMRLGESGRDQLSFKSVMGIDVEIVMGIITGIEENLVRSVLSQMGLAFDRTIKKAASQSALVCLSESASFRYEMHHTSLYFIRPTMHS